MTTAVHAAPVALGVLGHAVLALALGCAKNDTSPMAGGGSETGDTGPGGASGEGVASSGSGVDSGTATTRGGATASDSGSEGLTGASTDSATATDPTSGGGAGTSTSASTTAATGGAPVDPAEFCGKVYACADGEDNDNDGLIDGGDPECTGPCDDLEGSFQTGLPGDNVDCWQDCFFDGDSGHGNDGCRWNLRCDPENPGGGVRCEYRGANSCDSMPPDTPEVCVDFCAPRTPNGCDCFGCCEFTVGDKKVSVFLGSGEDCSVSNLEACASCTLQIEACGNPCNPEACEVCIGQTAPPEGCDQPKCPEGVTPCGGPNPECDAGSYCVSGCCVALTIPR